MKKVICNVLAIVLMTSGGNLCMAAESEAEDLVCVVTEGLNEENQDATQKDRKDSEDLCEPLKTEGLTEQQKNDIKALLDEYNKKTTTTTSVLREISLLFLKLTWRASCLLVKLICSFGKIVATGTISGVITAILLSAII